MDYLYTDRSVGQGTANTAARGEVPASMRPDWTQMLRFVGVLLFLLSTSCGGTTVLVDEDVQGSRPTPETKAAPAHHRGNLWYRIAIEGTTLEVRVRLFQPPKSTRFFLPSVWGGRSDFAQRIRISGASGPEGPRFLTIDRNEGRVEVDSADAEWVELVYAIALEEPPSPLHAGLSSGVLSLYGPAFLVLPAQQILDRSRDIRIEFHAPDTWTVVSTWPQISESRSETNSESVVHGFHAPDGQGLRDAFLAAGSNLTVASGLADIRVAFGPSFTGDRSRLVTVIDAAVSRYRGFFGHLGTVHVLVTTPSHADEGHLGGLGRRGGFVLELPHRSTVDGPTTLLVWHEALHLWNGHQVVPDADAESRTRWFKEGVTHFLALQAACSDDAISESFLFEELARIVDAYERNPARTGKGEELDRVRLPYDQGALLGMSFELADPGLNARWLQRLLADNAAEGFYNQESLSVAFQKAATTREATSLWTQHVSQQQSIDAALVLRHAGLHFFRGSDGAPRVAPIEGPQKFRNLFGKCAHEK